MRTIIRNTVILFILSFLLFPLIAGGAQEAEMMDQSEIMAPPGSSYDEYMKPSEKDLMNKLTNLQFKVTQQEGTETPFQNEYWDNHEAGIYVDIVSGEPLFSSTDKFESGTGWPSFTRPISDGNVDELVDTTYGMKRVEVRSFYADSHLGHLFEDGPEPTGQRYCINSASLMFIPVAELKSEGYESFLPLFAEGE